MESSIDEIDDFIHKMEAELEQAGEPEEYYGILEDLEHAKHLKTEKQLKSGIISQETGNDLDIDAVKWADEDIDDVDPDNMPVFSDWIAANSVKTNVAHPVLEKAAKSKMTDEEVSALQDYIKKQVAETKTKMSNGAIKKTQHIYDPATGEVHEKESWVLPDEMKALHDKLKESMKANEVNKYIDPITGEVHGYPAPYSKGTNPEDAELPWAYGGLLNRISKFYNNDRSSMLNLVRKVKAGMN